MVPTRNRIHHEETTGGRILSMVLRAVSDQPFHQILQEQLWEPIGMKGDAMKEEDSLFYR